MQNPSLYSLLIFLISIYLLNTKEPSMITIPLKLIKNSFGKYQIITDTELILEKEVDVQTPLGKQTSKLKEQIAGHIQILNSALFAVPITIGFNQTFNVILDIGSVHLWVPKKGSLDKYELENHYDPNLSDNEIKTTDPFEIKYDTGETR